MRLLSILLVLVLMPMSLPARSQLPEEAETALEVLRAPELKQGGDLNTVVPWRSILSEDPPREDACFFEVLIDPVGKVRKIDLRFGFESVCESSRDRLSESEFESVKRWWRGQWAKFGYFVGTVPDDYAGPADRTFPDNIDLGEVVITMVRTTCFGTCPAYSVQIHGDGHVFYEGEAFVRVEGRQAHTASRKDIRRLLELFEDADFFRKPADYSACMTDAASYYVQLEIGAMKKSLVDYVGDQISETCGGEDMPPIIKRIENEIDRVAGTERWIE